MVVPPVTSQMKYGNKLNSGGIVYFVGFLFNFVVNVRDIFFPMSYDILGSVSDNAFEVNMM